MWYSSTVPPVYVSEMVLDIGVWVAYGPCVVAIPPGRAVAQRGKANIIRLPGAQVPLNGHGGHGLRRKSAPKNGQ